MTDENESLREQMLLPFEEEPLPDRYEHIDMILKSRPEGPSWFDLLFDFIAQDCQGGGGDCIVEEDDESDCDNHDHEEVLPCTCGMESMGGTQGTLQQCFDATENVGKGLKLIDLARALVVLAGGGTSSNTDKALEWANSEINFEDHWNDEV